MTKSTTATPTQMIPLTMNDFPSLLRATRDLAQPYGAIIFTVLTTLLRFHELLRPTTTVEGGMLRVADAHRGEGSAHGRLVPLPRAVRQILVRDTGPLTLCLGISNTELGGLAGELRRSLTDLHEEETGSLEELWPLAVHRAMITATTARTRSAVLAFSGIHPTGRKAAAERATLCPQDLQSVADLLDALVVAAGFGLTDVAESQDVESA